MEVPIEQWNWFKLQMLLTKIEENLRELFKTSWRKRFKKNWPNDEMGGSKLMKLMGVQFNSIGNAQKKTISLGDVSQWDISTLSKILSFIDNSESEDIRQIVEIRNILAHHPDKIIPRMEFQDYWSVLLPISKELGLSEYEINEIYFRNHTNEEIIEEFIKIKAEGNNLFKNDKFEEAIKAYSRAIVLPNLTNEQMGTLYSNRCASYLKQAEEQSNKLALEDAKECKRLSPTWYKSYLRIAKAQMALKEYSSALDAYDQAIGLEPNNKDLQIERNYCRYLKVEEQTRMNLDPSSNVTMMDAAKFYSQRSGRTAEEEFKILQEKEDSSIKSETPDGFYALANRYRNGILVEKNDELAAKFYAKAAIGGHLEAKHQFGLCKIKGLGVKLDMEEGIDIMKDLAREEKNYKGKGYVPPGIVSSQYTLGVMNQFGIGVPICPSTALYWYEKSAFNGCGLAATNLGCMYDNGYEVERDEGKAIQYWEMASLATPPIPRAMEYLAYHYLEKEMIKDAELYWKRAKEHGHVFTQASEKIFQDGLKGIKKFKRAAAPSAPISKIKIISSDIIQASEDGSLFAARIRYSATYLNTALKLLFQNPSQEDTWDQIILNLGKCIETEEYVTKIPIQFNTGILKASNRIMEMGKSSEFDKYARFCFCFLNIRSYKEMLPFLDGCIAKYPQAVKFYDFKLGVLSILGEIKQGLKEAEKYLKIFPNDLNITLQKAVFASHNEENIDVGILACEEFLNIAPKDHRKTPLCYYSIATRLVAKSRRNKMPDLMDQAKENFQKGLDAEKLQFKMFLPQDSPEKETLKEIFDLTEPKVIENGDKSDKKEPEIDLKSLLLHTHRVAAIKRHRQFLNREIRTMSMPYRAALTFEISKEQSAPSNLVGLSEIFLREMDPSKDMIHDKKLINLQVIEGPIQMFTCLGMIVEDSKRQVITLGVYNFDREKGVHEHFGVGAKLTLLNPYMRLAHDGNSVLRVDDPKSIIFLNDERAKKLCTFCGKVGAERKCSKCKVNYCSRECQENDWKKLEHKLICLQD